MQEEEKIEEYIKDFGQGAGSGWRERLSAFLSGRYFIAAIVVLVAVAAFALGRISGLEEKREAVKVYNSSPNPLLLQQEQEATQPNPAPDNQTGEVKGATTEGEVVASKNGTKYHYPWCAGAKQIAEKNRITFRSIAEARASGYTPAANCKGLK